MADEMAQVQCPQCGKPNRNQAKFCVFCGNVLLPQAVTQPSADVHVGQQSSPDAAAQPGSIQPAAPSIMPQPRGPEALPSPNAAPAPMQPPAAIPSEASGTSPVAGVAAALAGAFQAVASLVRDLWPGNAGGADVRPQTQPEAAPGDYGMGLKPVSGKASHVGQVRPVNEDSLIAFEFTKVQESRGVPIGFYVVADGMGGHRAGEIASRTVNKIVTEKVLHAEVIPGLAFATRKLDETPASVLTSAVKEANRILYDLAQKQGSDMGTTLTAALIIGDTATIANVGDSRTYLWRHGTLRQVTRDHSLVASLVQAGMLKPEEARGHPQRSQIYRTLGVKPDVEVDIFSETLQRGDRLLLCSDGLWEMVSDVEIARAVGQARSPQEICETLIRQANQAGGQDNITVIVVKME